MAFHPRFPRERLEFSETATRKGIDNRIPDSLLENAQRLSYFLADLEIKLGWAGLPSVIQISSGYRCPALNAAVGGSAESNHMDARAADIVITGLAPNRLASFAQSAVIDVVDEVILEYGSWTHIAIAKSGAKPLSRIRTAKRIIENGKTKTVYLDGIVPV